MPRFTCELNEYEDGVAPSDSRLRPDQRLMEEGKWDEANTEKVSGSLPTKVKDNSSGRLIDRSIHQSRDLREFTLNITQF